MEFFIQRLPYLEMDCSVGSDPYVVWRPTFHTYPYVMSLFIYYYYLNGVLLIFMLYWNGDTTYIYVLLE